MGYIRLENDCCMQPADEVAEWAADRRTAVLLGLHVGPESVSVETTTGSLVAGCDWGGRREGRCVSCWD